MIIQFGYISWLDKKDTLLLERNTEKYVVDITGCISWLQVNKNALTLIYKKQKYTEYIVFTDLRERGIHDKKYIQKNGENLLN